MNHGLALLHHSQPRASAIVGQRGQARYRADIDGLRGIAVLAVVAFHANAGWAAGGFTGVDVFFVISGFLITGIVVGSLERQSFSFAEFYARRVRRIFPALIVVLGGAWVAGWVLLLPDAYQGLGRHVAGGAGFVANIVNWRESGYFDAAAEQKPLLHLWSLGLEEQFYLVWPALLIIVWRWRLNLGVALGTVAAASFIVNVAAVHAYPSATFYLPSSRVWELSLGGLLAVLFRSDGGTWRFASRLSQNAASAIGAGLIVVAVVALDRTQAFPGWLALVPTAGTALVIAAGEDAWFNRRVLANRALVFVGLLSYPLYLWHWPLLTYARLMTLRPLTVAEVAAIIVLAFALAWITYRIVELPIRSATQQPRGRQAVIGLGVVMVAIAISGVWTEATRGLPARFEGERGPIANFDYDYGREYREGTCFLTGDQLSAGFGAGCVDPETTAATPMLALWGDSHAAHLYPGLRRLQQTYDFRLAQFTTGACPPSPEARRFDGQSPPQCPGIYPNVRAAIERLKPATVVLAAQWAGYVDLSPLTQTVDFLRSIGGVRIVLVGPVPQWTQPLPRVLLAAFQQDPLHRFPSRTWTGTRLFRDVDAKLRDLSERLGLVYVAPLDILCNDDGCLARQADRPGALTAWDDSHLTSIGSQIVVEAAAPQLFDQKSRVRVRP